MWISTKTLLASLFWQYLFQKIPGACTSEIYICMIGLDYYLFLQLLVQHVLKLFLKVLMREIITARFKFVLATVKINVHLELASVLL